ncbi:ROK family protein [Terrisporobacter sp.]
MVNNKMMAGVNGSVGEIGRIKVNPYETEKCNCG